MVSFALFLGSITSLLCPWHDLVQEGNQQETQSNLDSSETIRREHFGKEQRSVDSEQQQIIFKCNLKMFFCSNRQFFVNNSLNFIFKVLFFASKGVMYLFSLLILNKKELSTSSHTCSVGKSNDPNCYVPMAYNFTTFQQMRQALGYLNTVPNSFLEWFVGFSEGDGSFHLKEGRPNFVINQADLQVLQKIRQTLGIGCVSTFLQQGSRYGRFVVQNKDKIACLIVLFNGNIQLQKVQTRFENWVITFNQIYNNNIQVLPKRQPHDISLQTAWLSGLFDSEGGFSGYITVTEIKYRGKKHPSTPPRAGVPKFRHRLYVKAYLDQKSEPDTFKQIATLFQVKKVTIRDAVKEHDRVELTSKAQVSLVMSYLTHYNLQGRKRFAYQTWTELSETFAKSQHL